LEVPREIDLDEAISIAEPYIPSFIELYATLMATGSYSMADRVYEYYVENVKSDGTMPLIITIFEQMTLKTKYKDLDSLEQTNTYYKNTTGNKDSGWEEISKAEHDSLYYNLEAKIKKENSSLWHKIADFFVDLWNDLKAAFQAVGRWIDDIKTEIENTMGWDTDITRDFIAVVEKGHAYEYKVSSKYKMDAETYEVDVNDVARYIDEAKFPDNPIEMDVEYSYDYEVETSECAEYYPHDEGETPVCKTYKKETVTSNSTYSGGYIQLKTKSTITWDQTHTITQNIILPEEHNVEKYSDTKNGKEQEYENRYVWVMDQIEEEEREEFQEDKEEAEDEGKLDEFLEKYSLVTADQMSYAIDIIDAHYSETFGLLGGVSAGDFTMAGSLNYSVVNYAKQFKGYNLAQMMAIDDTNTFFANHWCAMFVSFCMKKAGVGVPKFPGCATFWRENRDKPGFVDVVDSNHGGYITSNPEHRGSINNIQPGDIVLFRWPGNTTGRSHTGICSEVERNAAGAVIKIKVIEGNSGNSNYTRSKVAINEYTYTASSAYSNISSIVSYVSISAVQAAGGW